MRRLEVCVFASWKLAWLFVSDEVSRKVVSFLLPPCGSIGLEADAACSPQVQLIL